MIFAIAHVQSFFVIIVVHFPVDLEQLESAEMYEFIGTICIRSDEYTVCTFRAPLVRVGMRIDSVDAEVDGGERRTISNLSNGRGDDIATRWSYGRPARWFDRAMPVGTPTGNGNLFQILDRWNGDVLHRELVRTRL